MTPWSSPRSACRSPWIPPGSALTSRLVKEARRVEIDASWDASILKAFRECTHALEGKEVVLGGLKVPSKQQQQSVLDELPNARWGKVFYPQ